SITPSTSLIVILSRFLLTAPSPPHLSTLSLHDALPILMRHVRTRPSAIYLASCLQNLQTLNAPRNNSEAAVPLLSPAAVPPQSIDRKSTRLNSSHQIISYAVFCLKKKNQQSQSTITATK